MSHEVLQPEWKNTATIDAPIRTENGGSFWFTVGEGRIVGNEIAYQEELELVHVASDAPEAASVCGARGAVSIDASQATCLRCRVLGDAELVRAMTDAARMLRALVPRDETTAARYNAELGMMLGIIRLRIGVAMRAGPRPESTP